MNKPIDPPWSPSAARDAVRADRAHFLRVLAACPGSNGIAATWEPRLAAALRADRCFDSPEAFLDTFSDPPHHLPVHVFEIVRQRWS